MDINKTLALEFKLRQEQVDNTVALIDDDKTIPFIARYRKEQTGALDDQLLRRLYDRLIYLRNLEKRKSEVLSQISEQGKLTDEIAAALSAATALVEVEDIYRPFKPKRRTRGSIAREKGLEPLAAFLLMQQPSTEPLKEAARFVDEEKGVATAEEALQGASDIIAEDISDDAQLRARLRVILRNNGFVVSSAAKDEDSVYRDYYEFREPVSKIAGHRVLAIDRGEKTGFLKASLELDPAKGIDAAASRFCKNGSECGRFVAAAAEDAYRRLIFPSIEREQRAELTEAACNGSIKVYISNLRQLLLQPPIKDSIVLGLDPAYRTGCKIAVIDKTGKVLETTVVYPTPPQSKIAEAKAKLLKLIDKYNVNCISVGNGTASRESEAFVADLIRETSHKVSYMIVSEAGASVYSASKLAAEEFPEYDVSLRSAVSIARRLQDPLAELVKIDPKAIGVGQYQHDMPKGQLDEALGGVVQDCVNSVGVDLNTASHSLLSYVSGINATVAKNIVAYREENGRFTDRKQLLKVPKLGKKAFEQCAGFLRVLDGKNPLDSTAVHPESYPAAEALLELCGFNKSDIGDGLGERLDSALPESLTSLSERLGIGVPTLRDIVSELKKPGRDLRDELPPPLMRSGDIMEMKDLKPGDELVGTVRNIIDFGAFVDIGVHEDGLVHISQLCDRFIKHPLEVVKVGQTVRVRVLDVDPKKKRISLTMKGIK